MHFAIISLSKQPVQEPFSVRLAAIRLAIEPETAALAVLDTEIIRISPLSCAATMDETGDNTVITYSLKGFADIAATFNVCDERSSSDYSGRQIALSLTGRPATDGNFTCP